MGRLKFDFHAGPHVAAQIEGLSPITVLVLEDPARERLGRLERDLWGNLTLTACSSRRRLLDGVAMPVPHSSTGPARQRHRAPDTLVDFRTARDGML